MITELHDGTFYAEIELARDGGTHADLVPALRRHRPGGPLRRRRCRSSPTRRSSTRPACSSRPDEDEEQIEQFREFLDQVRPEDFARRAPEPPGRPAGARVVDRPAASAVASHVP